MRGFLGAALALTVMVGASGCRNQFSVQRPLATTEPPLIVGSGETVVGGGPPVVASTNSSVVDRHPLLNKPGQYYNSTNGNKLVKTASATFIGVPAGIVGEVRQIVVGQPSATTLP